MQATHRPKKNAERRTKNRFKEHTLVMVRTEKSTICYACNTNIILFESVEKDEKGRFARWTGWIPACEVERIER